ALGAVLALVPLVLGQGAGAATRWRGHRLYRARGRAGRPPARSTPLSPRRRRAKEREPIKNAALFLCRKRAATRGKVVRAFCGLGLGWGSPPPRPAHGRPVSGVGAR